MPNQEKQQNDEISIQDLILKIRAWYRYLLSRWLTILIAVVVGGTLGLIYSIVKNPVYIATLTFALEGKGQNSALGSYAGLAGQLGFNIGGESEGVFSENNILDLMKSRLMITEALLSDISRNGEKESLADFYIDFKHLKEAWNKDGRIPANINFSMRINIDSLSYLQDSLMGEFYKQILTNNINIDRPDNKGSIIAVTCKSTNELFAKYFVEALTNKVSTFYIQTTTQRATQNLKIIQKRLDSIRNSYTKALLGTAENVDQNLNPSRAIVGVPRIRNQTEAQILGAEYAELVKNLEIAKMAVLQETPLVQIIDRPILPLEKKKIGKLKGIIIGGVIAFILTSIWLIVGKVYSKLIEYS